MIYEHTFTTLSGDEFVGFAAAIGATYALQGKLHWVDIDGKPCARITTEIAGKPSKIVSRYFSEIRGEIHPFIPTHKVKMEEDSSNIAEILAKMLEEHNTKEERPLRERAAGIAAVTPKTAKGEIPPSPMNVVMRYKIPLVVRKLHEVTTEHDFRATLDESRRNYSGNHKFAKFGFDQRGRYQNIGTDVSNIGCVADYGIERLFAESLRFFTVAPAIEHRVKKHVRCVLWTKDGYTCAWPLWSQPLDLRTVARLADQELVTKLVRVVEDDDEKLARVIRRKCEQIGITAVWGQSVTKNGKVFNVSLPRKYLL